MDDSGDVAATNEYRFLLIRSINAITQNYPETIPLVLGPLMDSFLLFDKSATYTSLETIQFVREVIEKYPEYRQTIISKICSTFEDIRSHIVLRLSLWIMGEYCVTSDEVQQIF